MLTPGRTHCEVATWERALAAPQTNSFLWISTALTQLHLWRKRKIWKILSFQPPARSEVIVLQLFFLAVLVTSMGAVFLATWRAFPFTGVQDCSSSRRVPPSVVGSCLPHPHGALPCRDPEVAVATSQPRLAPLVARVSEADGKASHRMTCANIHLQ